MKRLGIKRIGIKLWSGMMFMAAVVLLLLWLFQIVFLEQFYMNIKLSDLTKESKEVIDLIDKEGELDSIFYSAKIIDTLEEFAYDKQLLAQIVDKQGNIIYEVDSGNSTMSPGMFRRAFNEVITEVLTGKMVKLEAAHPRFNSNFMLLGLPIYIRDELQGAMILNVPKAPVEETVSILKQQLVYIILILLIVSLIIAYQLTRAFTKPILNIHEVAKSYTRGNFHERVRVRSGDELGQLAESMNRMGEELTKNEQLRKDLIANVSHELRTPLSLIRGYAETLRDVTGENPEKREKQLGIIVDETERLSRIVEDILVLSRFQAGAIELELSVFSVKEMLTEILERYELLKETRTLSVTGLNEMSETVFGDKGRIEQVLYNLLNNAFNHTKENDHINISLSDEGDSIRFAVQDTGEGMDREELPYVFDRYYRGNNTDRNKRAGTGLGLAIVKSILQMHQASFGVESVLGKGSTFWFKLKKNNSHNSF